MTKLTLTERALAAQAGWTAECARQKNATHLANSYKVTREVAKTLPSTLDGCLKIGAMALRGHLKSVRG